MSELMTSKCLLSPHSPYIMFVRGSLINEYNWSLKNHCATIVTAEDINLLMENMVNTMCVLTGSVCIMFS